MATRFDDELAAVLAQLEASGKGIDTWIDPIVSMPTATPEEEDKKRGLLSTLGTMLHAPKRQVDLALNYAVGGPLAARVYNGEEPVPAGELAKNAYIAPPEAGQDPTEQHLRAVGRGITERAIDTAVDPVNVGMMVAGGLLPKAAATLVNVGFGGMMLKGAVESADATYETYKREGWTPTTSEEAAKTVFDTGFAAMAARDLARTFRPRRPGVVEPEVVPPEERPSGPGAVIPGWVEARPIPGRAPRAPIDRQLGTGQRRLTSGLEEAGVEPPAPPPPTRPSAPQIENVNIPGDPGRLSDDALLSTLNGFDGAIQDAASQGDWARVMDLRSHRSRLQDLYRARRYDPSVQVGRAGDLMQLRDSLQQERLRGPGVKRDMEIAESLQVIDAELSHLQASTPVLGDQGVPAPPTFTPRTPRAPAAPEAPAAPAPEVPPSRMPQVVPQEAAAPVSPQEPAAALPGELAAQRPGVQDLLERAQATVEGQPAPERIDLAKVVEPPTHPGPVAPAETAAPVVAPATPAVESAPAVEAPPSIAAPTPPATPSMAPAAAPKLYGRRLTPAAAAKKRAAGPISVIEIDGQPYWSNNHFVVRGRGGKGAVRRELDVKAFHKGTAADVPAQPIGFQAESTGSTKVHGETTPGRLPAIWMKGEVRNGKKVYVPVDPDYYQTLEAAGPGRWAVDRKGGRLTRFDSKGAIVGSVAKLNIPGEPPDDLEPIEGVAAEPQATGDVAAAQGHEAAIEAATIQTKSGERILWKNVPEPPKDELGNRILTGQEDWTPERRKLVHAGAEAAAREVAQNQAAEPTGRHAILDAEGKTDYNTAREGGSHVGGYVVNSHKGGTALEDVAAGPKEIVRELKKDKGNTLELEVHQKVDGWNQDYAFNHAAEVSKDPLWAEAYPEDIARGLEAARQPVARGEERRTEPVAVPVERRVAARRRTVAAEVGLPEDHPAVIRAADAEIEARTDKLTGLGNRAHWDEVLATTSPADHVSVLDLKKFKPINDTLGHAAGDAILQRVASVLDERFDGDAARFGGDEFGTVLRGVSLEDAKTQMEQVRKELGASVVNVTDPKGNPVAVEGIEAHIGVGRDAESADAAANAEAAESRKGGRGALPPEPAAEPGTPGPRGEGLPDRVGRTPETVPEVGRSPSLELDLRFPLGKRAMANLQEASGDPFYAALANRLGIKSIRVDPPHTFELSQTGAVTDKGTIRVSPNSSDFVGTIAHELGHVSFEAMSVEQRAKARRILSAYDEYLKESAPGYWEEQREDEMWAHLVQQRAPEARDLALEVERTPPPPQPESAPIASPRPLQPSTWADVDRRWNHNLMATDDLAALARESDRTIVIKDVNGGRHIVQTSEAARLLNDPVFDGHVREVWALPEGEHRPTQLDEEILKYLPEMKTAAAKALRGIGPGEAPRKPVYEKTPLGDQALIPGTLDAVATLPTKKPAETFAEAPLFRQEETAAARAEEEAFKAAQLPIEAVQVALEDQGLAPGELGAWGIRDEKPGSLTTQGASLKQKAWIEVRNRARDLVDALSEGKAAEKEREAAASQRLAFSVRYGPVHEAKEFASDPDYALVLALEDYTPASTKQPGQVAPIKKATSGWSELVKYNYVKGAEPISEEELGARLAKAFDEAEAAGGGGGSKQPPSGPPKPRAPEAEPSKWRRIVNAAKARTRARGKGGQANIGVDPQAAADIAIEGADYAYRGARAFGTWAEVMMRTVGRFVSGLRGMLGNLWRTIRGLFTPKPTATEEATATAEAAPSGGQRPPFESFRPRSDMPPRGKRPRYEWEKQDIPPEDFARASEAGKQTGEPGAPEPKYGKPPKADFNFARHGSMEDVREWMARAMEELHPHYKKVRSYRSWSEAKELADRLGWTEEDFARVVKKRGVVTDWEMRAGSDLLQEAGQTSVAKLNRLKELQERMKTESDPLARSRLRDEILEADREYRAALAQFIGISSATVEAASEVGRSLGSLRKLIDPVTPEEKFFRKLLRDRPNLTEKQMTDLADAVMRKDAKALMDLSRAIYKPKLMDYAREWYINSLLSSVSTFAANTFSNLIWEGGFRTPERGLSAFLDQGTRQVIERLFGREATAPERFFREMEEAFRAHVRLGFGLPKAGSLAWEAIFNEAPLRAGGAKGEFYKTAWPGFLGKVIRTPSRIMDALDVGARHSAMSAEAAVQAVRMAISEARRSGGWTHDQVSTRMKEIQAGYEKYVDLEAQRRSGKVLDAEGYQYLSANRKYGEMMKSVEKAGLEGVFRDQVDSLTRALMAMRTAHPWMNFFIPFVATPSRILAQALKRSPFGAYSVFRRAKSGELQGGALSDEMAKVVYGNLIGASLYLLARQGFLTGSGPSDPDEARVWKDTGKQPYAVKLGNTWVSLARLEPLSTTLGWAADLAEAKDEKTAGRVYDKLVQSAMANIVNKSYLQSVTGLAEGIADPERNGPLMLRRLAGGFVPNILAAAARSIDPTVRETPDVWSSLIARVPILSETLPAKHSGTGAEVSRGEEPVSRFLSPFRYSQELGPEGNLERIMLSTGYIPQAPPKQLTIPGTFGKKIELVPEERALYAAYAKRATDFARTLAAKDEFMTLDPIVQEELLKRIYRYTHDRAHQAMVAAVAARLAEKR